MVLSPPRFHDSVYESSIQFTADFFFGEFDVDGSDSLTGLCVSPLALAGDNALDGDLSINGLNALITTAMKATKDAHNMISRYPLFLKVLQLDFIQPLPPDPHGITKYENNNSKGCANIL